MLAFTFTAIIFCTIGLALGQGLFTASPADAIVSAGHNITVTCDSGMSGVQPAATSNNNEVTIENITPPGTPSQMRIFQTSAFSRSHNGTVLTCRDPDDMQIGSITVIVLYEPLITGLNDITVNESQQVSFTVTIDSNPPVNVSAGDVIVTPLPAMAIMLNQVNTNTVSVTIPSVTVNDANTYTITASNSEGSDTQSFVLTVNQLSSTLTQATTGTASESVTAMIETITSTSSIVSSTGTATMVATPSASPSPTDDTVQGSGSNMKLASAVTVLLLIIIVFFF